MVRVMFAGKLVLGILGLLGGGIIGDDHFKRAIGLRQNGCDRSLKIRRTVKVRHDHRHKRQRIARFHDVSLDRMAAGSVCARMAISVAVLNFVT